MKEALGDDEVFITGEVFNGGVKVQILSYIAFTATHPLRLAIMTWVCMTGLKIMMPIASYGMSFAHQSYWSLPSPLSA